MVQMSACDISQLPSIQLSPFIHQVGGHSSMFQYDSNTVCKLLAPSELEFYQTIPESLKEFAPQFRGVVTVQYFEDESGNIRLLAQPQTLTVASNEETNSSSQLDSNAMGNTENTLLKSIQLRCSKDGRIDYSTNLAVDLGNYEQGKITMSMINPWNLQLCKKQVEKLHRQLVRDENATISQSYMLLENITARFHYPCILDLKMGKRQYGDVDCEKKRLSKIEKCESSTSAKLGVRLCGMQVYQIDSNRYKFTDKYRGRALSVEGFRSTLVQYFDNGRSQRRDVLPSLIKRLESLHKTIDSLVQYRFYGGSLLIVYDGSLQSNAIDVRMIDFAHTTRVKSTENDSSNEDLGPDQGYLLGIECLIDVFKGILKSDD